MIKLLQKLFIKTTDDKKTVRRKTGIICSGFGILLNIILFIIKYIAGALTLSITITADAFNNLSDAGSSLIALMGFKFADIKPDKRHPFGHGRIEYLSGLGISVAIIILSLKLGYSSIKKIIFPEPLETSITAFIILGICILVKIYMYIYNHNIDKELNSASIRASAIDSLSDAFATAIVMISMIVSIFTKVNIDGYTGVLVALLIMYAGINSAKDTIAPLLGTTPDKEFVDNICDIVMKYEKVKGIHDLVVHDYGPNRQIISLHAEIDGNENIYEIHDMIDKIENDLYNELGCMATIHMDPVDLSDTNLIEMKYDVANLLKKIDEKITIHDFRIVSQNNHNKLIFDIVVPFEIKLSDDEIKKEAQKLIREKYKNYYAVIHIDKN